MTTMFLLAKKWAKSRTEKLVKSLGKIYGSSIGNLMADYCANISKTSIRNVVKACASVDIPNVPIEDQSKFIFEYGSKNRNLNHSKKILKSKLPKAELFIREGYSHCEYVVREPEKYVENLEEIIKRDCN